MKPEYVPPTPKPETPPAPVAPVPPGLTQADLDARLAEQKAQIEREREEFKARSAAYDARMALIENVLHDRFTNKVQPPTDPGPVVTPEDFLTPDGALKAVDRLATEKAKEMASAIDANYRGTMQSMLEDQFDTKLESIKNREYYSFIKADLEAAIAKNPKIRLAPKALDILYQSYVGAHAAEIAEAARQKVLTEQTTIRDTAPPPPPSPRGGRERVAAPGPPSSGHDDVPALSAREEEIRNSFSRFVPNLTPERWAEIREERAHRRSDIPAMEERGRR